MVRCLRIDVALYENFYAKLGVQIWTTLFKVYGKFWSVNYLHENAKEFFRKFYRKFEVLSDVVQGRVVQKPVNVNLALNVN